MCTLFAYFGLPGGMEVLIVGLIILLLFGNRLPGLMRSLGRSVVEFKKGVKDDELEVKGEGQPEKQQASKDA